MCVGVGVGVGLGDSVVERASGPKVGQRRGCGEGEGGAAAAAARRERQEGEQGRSDAALEAVDACLEALYNLANAAHLVKFNLELVNFLQYSTEACYLGVGVLDGMAGTIVLGLGSGLGLLGELK